MLNYPERFAAMLKYINSDITISEKHYYKVNINNRQSKFYHPNLCKYGDRLKIEQVRNGVHFIFRVTLIAQILNHDDDWRSVNNGPTYSSTNI